MNELTVRMRSVRPILLLSLLVLGALAGLSIREFFLVRYQARISLPMSGDLATFRETEPFFGSSAMFEKYGAKQNLSNNADFEKIRQQFARNLASPIKIEHAFRLLKKDVRDLPDMYAKDGLSRQIGSQGLQSDVQVYAIAGEPATAIRLAKLAMGYVRESLTAVSLRSCLQQWGPGARAELAAKKEIITKLQSDLASADRRIESMEQLKDRFKDEKDFYAQSSNSVQVQVTGTRSLSPLQQMIGSEVDRADLTETLRSAEQDKLRLETLVHFSDLFDSRADGGASIDLVKEILTLANQSRPATVDDNTNPKDRALTNIGAQMQGILARFAEAKTDFVEPEVRFAGIGPWLAVLFGLVSAAAAWLLLVLLFPASRSRPNGVI